jgi:hypothetical protein
MKNVRFVKIFRFRIFYNPYGVTFKTKTCNLLLNVCLGKRQNF